MRKYYVKSEEGNYIETSAADIYADLLTPAKRGDVINSIQAAIGTLKNRLKDTKKEMFLAVFVDHGNRIMAIKTWQGVEDQCPVFPRELMQLCLKNRATGILVAHNHPTGATNPSQADREITKKIQAACEALDIRFLDHIIMGHGYFSFRESGLVR